MSAKREHYIVAVNRPQGVSISQMEAYIYDAVSTWGGQFHPDDPLHTANNEKDVRVCRAKWPK
jgi:hypothetical protein